MTNNCVFCAIAAGEIPSFKIYEDGDVLAFLDINPFSKGHTLVIPKAHSPCLTKTPDDTLVVVTKAVKKIASRIQDVLGCDGFNILQNNGGAAGQTVMHLHFHIVPRYGESTEKITFDSSQADMAELKELAAKLCMN